MIYTNVVGYLAIALGGIILGVVFGPKLLTDVHKTVQTLEKRLSNIEKTL